MRKIAIVDDDPNAAEQLQQVIELYGKEHGSQLDLVAFSDGDSFLWNYKMDFWAVFMDIQMPGSDGISIGKALRKLDPYVYLIFTTSFVKFAPEGYAVNAYDYILKPVSYPRIKSTLDGIEKLTQRNDGKEILAANKDGVIKVNEKDIYYVGIEKHNVQLHTANGAFRFWGSLKAFLDQVTPGTFSRCNHCFIINLRYVESVSNDTAIVHGTPVAVSRRRKKDLLSDLNLFLAR